LANLRPLREAGVIVRLVRHELSTQHRETLLGLATTVLWPLLQTFALLLAFGGLRAGGFAGWLNTYLGVLVWSAAAGVIASNLAIFRTNRELITQIVFPFYNLCVVDVTVKYLFSMVQIVIALGLLCIVSMPVGPAGILALLVFALCYYCALVAFGWLASLLGTLLPDLSFIVPALLLMLLVLSPIFHPAGHSTALHLVNLLNPLAQWTQYFYTALRAPALSLHLLLPPVLYAGALVFVAGMAVRYAFRELAKII
jgi:ABC-type polysaccharide/polyol phosphate export permease